MKIENYDLRIYNLTELLSFKGIKTTGRGSSRRYYIKKKLTINSEITVEELIKKLNTYNSDMKISLGQNHILIPISNKYHEITKMKQRKEKAIKLSHQRAIKNQQKRIKREQLQLTRLMEKYKKSV